MRTLTRRIVRQSAALARRAARPLAFAAAGVATLTVGAVGAAAQPGRPGPVTRSGARAAPGPWETLFDGRGPAPLAAWRGYRRDDVPPAWRVVDGALAVVPESALAVLRRTGDRRANGDLVTRATYGDFELAFTWRVARGGNSGVFYRVTEDDSTAWQSGPEFQLLDDAHHANGRIAAHQAGAIFGLVAPPPGVARSAQPGARWTPWQRGRLVVRGWRVEQYLNGRRVAVLDLASAEGRDRLARSPFARAPRFARAAAGHIGLQDQGDAVQFREVRVRRLGG